MACQKGTLFISHTSKRGAFRKDIPDVFVILFKSAFLPWSLRITIEKMSSFLAGFKIDFNAGRVKKFRAIISKDDFKKTMVGVVPKGITKPDKSFSNVFRTLVRKRDDDHKAAADKQESEKTSTAFAAASADYSIHLDKAGKRMISHEVLIIEVSTTNTGIRFSE